MTEENGPFHMGFVIPYFRDSKEYTEAYWTGKEKNFDESGNSKEFTTYHSTDLISMTFQEYDAWTQFNPKDKRVTIFYENEIWKPIVTMVRSRRMYASAKRPFDTKMKDVSVWKLGETKYWAMRFGAMQNMDNKWDAKTWIGTDLEEMRLVESSATYLAPTGLLLYLLTF